MLKSDSSLLMLIVAAVVALGVGYYVPRTFSQRPAIETAAVEPGTNKETSPAAVASPAKPSPWTASAPGRVEPVGGEVRISAQASGRVAEVLIGVGDRVQAGDLLVRLDDDEPQARILALGADVQARKRERDAGDVAQGNLARDRRTAEDNLATAERQLYSAREDLDRALRLRSTGAAGEQPDVDKARDAVTKARDRVEQTRLALRRASGQDGIPAPTRGEVALTAARADLSAAEAALERTRVRAGITGTVLALNARAGEVLVPSLELPVAMLGNLAQLRVRSEFEERDLGKVRDGQTAIVRADAFPGRDFEGKVTLVSPSMSQSRIGQRGPRRLNDIDVLEVLVNLTGETPLMPGMRVDVFLRNGPQASAQNTVPRAN